MARKPLFIFKKNMIPTRKKSSGIQSKLIKLLFIQLVVISLATLLGVYAAAKVVENVLMREALDGEAEHYWNLFKQNPDYPLPNTKNLLGFIAKDKDTSQVPKELKDLEPSYGRVSMGDSVPLVLVSDYQNNRLYLVFNELQVRDLAFYFGVAPLSVVLVLLYLLAWLSYRQARNAVSPVIQLAHTLDQFDFKKDRFSQLDLSHVKNASDTEVISLIDALHHFTDRLAAFINRERTFTRDASHELRTPLAIIKGSINLLERADSTPERREKAIERIRRTTLNMESLIETLLLLAREEEFNLPEEPIILNDLVKMVLGQVKATSNKEAVQCVLEESSLIEVKAPEKVISIILTNLIQNAYNYTREGEIRVAIEENQISVSDTGMGMTEEQVDQIFETFYRVPGNYHDGHGLGLSIVKRLCQQYSWPLTVSSKINEGSVFTIEFPTAMQIQKKVAASETS